jgi:hypothetical protein
MREQPDLRRILQESAAAPDVHQWFRKHAAEREKLLVLLLQARQPEERVRPRQAEGRSPLEAEEQLPVGPLLPPPGTYTFTAATPPVHAPDGEPLAQLSHVPDSLGAFIGVAFPPFGRAQKIPPNLLHHLPPPEERIAYRMVGLVQYQGEEGEVVIETIKPSPAVLRHQLMLGNPSGALADGTALFAMWGNHLRLRRDNVIIDLYAESRGMTQERLKALAEDMVLI